MSPRKLELVKGALPATKPVEARRAQLLFWMGASLYVISLLMIVGAILFAPPGQPTRWFEEKQTVTSYSSMLLYTCCLVSALNFLAARDLFYPRLTFQPLKWFWAMGVGGFFFLMADEFFVMHEGLGRTLAFRILKLPPSPFNNRLDTFVLAFYGVCALVILALYWRWLRLIPGFAAFLVAGGMFGALSLIMDLRPETIPGIYVEEGAKVFANTSFLLACLAAAVNNYKELLADMRPGSSADRDALFRPKRH